MVFIGRVDAAHGEHILRIGGQYDARPASFCAFVTGGVADQYPFFHGHVGRLADRGGAVRFGGPVVDVAVA